MNRACRFPEFFFYKSPSLTAMDGIQASQTTACIHGVSMGCSLCFVFQRCPSGNNKSTLWWILSMPIALGSGYCPRLPGGSGRGPTPIQLRASLCVAAHLRRVRVREVLSSYSPQMTVLAECYGGVLTVL